jgi:response regulator RpfG family c-di-GMP phosphodiesterase
MSWEAARSEIVAQSGRQFDPQIVEAFVGIELELHEIRRDLAAA